MSVGPWWLPLWREAVERPTTEVELDTAALLLAAQAVLAALLAFWLAPLFGEWSAAIQRLIVPGMPALELPVTLDSSWSDVAAVWSSVSSDLAQAVSTLGFAPFAWTITIATAAVLWLAGNRWLLIGRTHS